MIKFHKVRYKNFLSTGNSFTEIDLSRKKTTLIIGANGSGKSTLLDALTFGLCGRAFRKIPKTALINSINGKATVVEVEFPRQNIDEPNSGHVNPASGLYMIKSLSHQLLAEGDYTGLKLVRDSYSELS